MRVEQAVRVQASEYLRKRSFFLSHLLWHHTTWNATFPRPLLSIQPYTWGWAPHRWLLVHRTAPVRCLSMAPPGQWTVKMGYLWEDKLGVNDLSLMGLMGTCPGHKLKLLSSCLGIFSLASQPHPRSFSCAPLSLPRLPCILAFPPACCYQDPTDGVAGLTSLDKDELQWFLSNAIHGSTVIVPKVILRVWSDLWKKGALGLAVALWDGHRGTIIG